MSLSDPLTWTVAAIAPFLLLSWLMLAIGAWHHRALLVPLVTVIAATIGAAVIASVIAIY